MSQPGTPAQKTQTGLPGEIRTKRTGRNSDEKICLILNPKAAAGSAGKKIDRLKRALDKSFKHWELRLTNGPRHATALAAQACEEGFDLVAAAGGDGTCHEVINGMIHEDRPRNSKTAFSLIPLGTGSDLMKTIKSPLNAEEAIWIASTGVTLPCDVGRATITTEAGKETRYFINVAGFGANGEVVRQANASSKRFGGQVTFLKATLKTAMRYTPPRVQIEWTIDDQSQHWEGALLSCFVANGAYCGGGMWVGPNGSMHDGQADITILPAMSLGTQVLNMPKLYNGKLDQFSKSHCFQTAHLRATTTKNNRVYIDLDGELSGFLPASFSILPRLLPVRSGWLHSLSPEATTKTQ